MREDALHPLDRKPRKYYWLALLALLACGDGTYDPPDAPNIPPVVAI